MSESQISNLSLSLYGVRVFPLCAAPFWTPRPRLPGCFRPLNLWLSSNSGFVSLPTVFVWNFSSSSFFSQSLTMTYGSEDQPGSSEEPSRCVHLRK